MQNKNFQKNTNINTLSSNIFMIFAFCRLGGPNPIHSRCDTVIGNFFLNSKYDVVCFLLHSLDHHRLHIKRLEHQTETTNAPIACAVGGTPNYMPVQLRRDENSSGSRKALLSDDRRSFACKADDIKYSGDSK